MSEQANNLPATLNSDTIVAIATAIGSAGVGIIRISGAKALDIAQQVCRLTPQPRHAHFTSFYQSQQVIDQGLCIYFKAPHSFTGEDIVELQAHGGAVLLNILLQHVISLGARQARPGEFSERAFLNDKIDLAQAEAIADLIEASSETAARNAINTLQGKFSQRVHALAEKTLALRIYVEAAIDFPEEEIDFLQDTFISQSFLKIKQDLEHIIQQAKQGSLLKEGIKAVIIGKPNAGKSSLLNALAEKEAAIVTEIQGTTRDVLREHILIDDLPIHLIDTAGIRHSDDLIEQEGIRRAWQEIKSADLILVVNDVSQHQENNINNLLKDFESLENIEEKIEGNSAKIIVHNKCDLINKKPSHEKYQDTNIIYLSAKENSGLDYLKNTIKDIAQYQSHLDSQEGLFSARQRHQQALLKALDFLNQGKQQLEHHQAGELVAEDLRECQNALNEITGEFSSDDLLGEIFSSFCIGK